MLDLTKLKLWVLTVWTTDVFALSKDSFFTVQTEYLVTFVTLPQLNRNPLAHHTSQVLNKVTSQFGSRLCTLANRCLTLRLNRLPSNFILVSREIWRVSLLSFKLVTQQLEQITMRYD